MNPKSLAKTLSGQRPTEHAVLTGYKRKMNVPFGGYAYLNIVPRPDSRVMGILIPMTEQEFELFSSREEGYTKTDITQQLSGRIDGTAYAFIAPDIECSLSVPRSYILTCTAGMTSLEREQWVSETELKDIFDDTDKPVYEFVA